jgi:hypothetical protein
MFWRVIAEAAGGIGFELSASIRRPWLARAVVGGYWRGFWRPLRWRLIVCAAWLAISSAGRRDVT